MIVALICATTLAALGRLDSAAWIGLATLILGYVFGKASNGVEGLVKALAMFNQPTKTTTTTTTPPATPVLPNLDDLTTKG